MPPKIVLASRLSREPDATGVEATKLARAAGGDLVLLYVAAELSSIPELSSAAGAAPERMREQMLLDIQNELKGYVNRNIAPFPVRTRIEEGDVPRSILRVAAEENADYLVIGTEGGTSIRDLVVGSTSKAIIRGSQWPVLVVPRR